MAGFGNILPLCCGSLNLSTECEDPDICPVKDLCCVPKEGSQRLAHGAVSHQLERDSNGTYIHRHISGDN